MDEAERLRAALQKLACFDDEGANRHLKATGSYVLFDEPAAVMIAREALREGSTPTMALVDVMSERLRQRFVKGYTVEEDDGYDMAELRYAGAFYALDPFYRRVLKKAGAPIWPFARPPKLKGPRRDLVRAAALLIAEIERLDRALAAETAEGGQ